MELSANLLYASDKYVVVTRYLFYDPKQYKKEQQPPSLYYSVGKRGWLVVSEPITDQPYRLFPTNTMIVVQKDPFNIQHSYLG